MAYEMLSLPDARIEIRCVPGDIMHIAFNGIDDTWMVEEDPHHAKFRTRGEALDRARLLGKDPDFK
jgi:hypothetical protein